MNLINNDRSFVIHPV